jgi:hypothetical protein
LANGGQIRLRKPATAYILGVSGNQPRTMKSMILRFLLFFSLASCGVVQSDKRTVCNCCDTTYTNIDSALNCISLNPSNETNDNRLFLFAFAATDLENNRNADWDIIKDQDIIDAAKRNYLLIILDPKDIAFSKEQQADELIETIKGHRENLFFVITDQALYPFAEWTETERKDIIIERLEVGIGP